MTTIKEIENAIEEEIYIGSGTILGVRRAAKAVYSEFIAPLETQLDNAQRLVETLESIDAMIKDDMGELYGVEFSHLPKRFANLAYMRDAIASALEELESET